MSRNRIALSVAATLFAGAAFAEVPQVAVDIAPVHSLVARVMQGLGDPMLIVSQGASPHEYSLRASQASALQNADVVFWVSPDLTPWLDDAVDTLASEAKVVELLETDGTTELPLRENALFEAHDHSDHEDDDHEGHDDHDEHADQEGHDHGDHDPHAWLSPDNGAVWLNTIAATLSAADPENAGAYYANAAAGREDLADLKTEISSILDTARGGNFIVFHDAYQHFEAAFDFPATGAISVSDAADPSPARISAIQTLVADQNVTCVLSEPQFNPGIVASVMDGTQVNSGVLDPLGSDLPLGADLYPQMLRNLANALAECL